MSDVVVPEWLRDVPRFTVHLNTLRDVVPPASVCVHPDGEWVRLADVVAAAQEVEADARWSIAEHERAVTAIQQSEGLPPNTYPSFQERVWWRAFKERAEAAEAERDAMQGRADAAEADWQAAESRINELEVMVRDAQAGQPDLTALRAATAAYLEALKGPDDQALLNTRAAEIVAAALSLLAGAGEQS